MLMINGGNEPIMRPLYYFYNNNLLIWESLLLTGKNVQ